MNNKSLAIVCVLLCCVNMFLVFTVKPQHIVQGPQAPIIKPEVPIPSKPQPQNYDVDFVCPTGDMSFDEINAQLKKWAQQASAVVEYGTYGKTQSGIEIPYIRIGAKKGPKVLISSCIHGNEHLSAMVTMGCVGNMLKNYKDWASLFEERDFYYVPVICPDSFQKTSRHDMGIDPNRNFSDSRNNDIKSIPAIASLKEFQLKNKFKAFMSCHNYGKIYLYPWGYTRSPTDSDAEYKTILKKMSGFSNYQYEQLLRQSAPPYYGYETDWFYKNGAFAIVNEIGTRFEATKNEIKKEVDINLPAFRVFIEEAPLVRH